MKIYRGYMIRPYPALGIVEILDRAGCCLIDSTPTSIEEAEKTIDEWLNAR